MSKRIEMNDRYAIYKMKKDGLERNYSKCSEDFKTYNLALDAAQEIYEIDPSYHVEVRKEKNEQKKSTVET